LNFDIYLSLKLSQL